MIKPIEMFINDLVYKYDYGCWVSFMAKKIFMLGLLFVTLLINSVFVISDDANPCSGVFIDSGNCNFGITGNECDDSCKCHCTYFDGEKCRSSMCVPSIETNCDNRIDDDYDGKIDRLDSDCICGNGLVSPLEECDYGNNNIPNTTIWSSEKKCLNDCTWVPNYCGDERITSPYETCDRNSGILFGTTCSIQTGQTSCTYCDSTTCQIKTKSMEICTDGIDNDGDGKIDCKDPDCINKLGNIISNSICELTEKTCNDGFDNDGDGSVDCKDSDCLNNCECKSTGQVFSTGSTDDSTPGLTDDSTFSSKFSSAKRTLFAQVTGDSLLTIVGTSYATDYTMFSMNLNEQKNNVEVIYFYSKDISTVTYPRVTYYLTEEGEIIDVKKETAQEVLDSNDFSSELNENSLDNTNLQIQNASASKMIFFFVFGIVVVIGIFMFLKFEKKNKEVSK
jgi:hypothetical protein